MRVNEPCGYHRAATVAVFGSFVPRIPTPIISTTTCCRSIGAVKEEFRVSDTKLGVERGNVCHGVCARGLPIARWADRGIAAPSWCSLFRVECDDALCGMAQSFWQLALARFGLGATESGGIPRRNRWSWTISHLSARAREFVLISGTSAVIVGVVLGGSIAAAGVAMAFTAGGNRRLALASPCAG